MGWRYCVAWTLVVGILCGFANQVYGATQTVEAGHFTWKVKAVVHIPSGAIKGSLVFNPGAYLQPHDMSDLGAEAARRGIVTYIIDNAFGLPIAPNNQEASLRLATALVDGSLRGLPDSIAKAHQEGLKLMLAGHSMGGAVLSSIRDNLEIDIFSAIILVGVSKLVDDSGPFPVPTYMVYGTQDKVVDRSLLSSLANTLGAEELTMEGVNHFCIVSTNAGSEEFRSRDGETGLTKQDCVSRAVDAFEAILHR